MSDDTTEVEEEQDEVSIGIDLEPADDLMYESLVEEFGPEMIDADLTEVVKERVRALYDNRDAVAQQITKAQQQAALGAQ